MKPVILVIEDEAAIRTLLKFSLLAEHFEPILYEDVKPAFEYLKTNSPQLILLDWMLPSMSGIEFIQKLKQQAKTKHIPIIMLTAKAEEINKIKGLETGADDYITKPFSPRELITRIKTVLRRGILISPDNLIILGELNIDLNKQRVTVKQQVITLTPNSFKLLKFLVTHPHRVYSREELLNQVWGYHKENNERSVDAEIKRLRKALGSASKLIQTVRNSGYQFNLQGTFGEHPTAS
ncbi:MAG: hypothetical protein A3E87_02675 [Gammaproteobacteria bacterium RIFCSPHIGHO2_12_FULL_35_23]|nr:MAG: hypothetical protein A3E87_02675 [Gammaproteobacteria bacterium RIFCSPHIGHO2_12_FULL_35_23]